MHSEFNMIEYLSVNGKEITVLYAEDEIKLQDTVKRYLNRYFKKVDTASNGQDAYEKYMHEGPYDLIITDIKMPKMTGMELIEKIKEKNKNQEIIVISAFSEQENLMNAISN